jgi:hypothetical protein
MPPDSIPRIARPCAQPGPAHLDCRTSGVTTSLSLSAGRVPTIHRLLTAAFYLCWPRSSGATDAAPQTLEGAHWVPLIGQRNDVDLMLKIDKSKKDLVLLEAKTMRESGFWERRDIQEMICRSPDAFCEELNEYIHFVGSEVRPAEFVQDRIDLLGIDPDGSAVIVELKRDNHKLHLLQALSYGGMVAKWETKRFLDELCKFNKQKQGIEEAKEEIEEILDEGDIEAVNRNQRIVLLAEQFDYEVLITAEWLTEKYNVDIRCYRLALAKNGNDDFLTCTRAYPPPELTEVAIRRRRKKEIGDTAATSWDEFLLKIENQHEANFIRNQIALGQENKSSRLSITYRIGNLRQYRVYAKRQFAYVLQFGRFDDDVEFWRSRLSASANVGTRHGGLHLRFRLRTEDDFKNFVSAWNDELKDRPLVGSSEQMSDELVGEEGRGEKL